jgi:hypothetical protein
LETGTRCWFLKVKIQQKTFDLQQTWVTLKWSRVPVEELVKYFRGWKFLNRETTSRWMSSLSFFVPIFWLFSHFCFCCPSMGTSWPNFSLSTTGYRNVKTWRFWGQHNLSGPEITSQCLPSVDSCLRCKHILSWGRRSMRWYTNSGWLCTGTKQTTRASFEEATTAGFLHN